MAETTLPAAEAAEATLETERNSYELAFHILPTVAEGEVSSVFEEVKTLITKDEGEIFSEEAPQRIDLAYDIVKSLDGKNRKFASAYFGWVRFKITPDKAEDLNEHVGIDASILRHLMLKLTKADEENPYRIHETRVADTPAEIVEEGEDILADPLLDMGGETAAKKKESDAETKTSEEVVT